MTNPVVLDETIDVTASLPEAFAYLAEFSQIDQWDPGVARARQLTRGAPGVGTEFEIVMKAGFTLFYRIVDFRPDQRIQMSVDSRFFTAQEEIRFEPATSGTRIRYIARFNFPLVFRLFNRLFPAVMDRVGKSAMAGLKRALSEPGEDAAGEVGAG